MAVERSAMQHFCFRRKCRSQPNVYYGKSVLVYQLLCMCRDSTVDYREVVLSFCLKISVNSG